MRRKLLQDKFNENQESKYWDWRRVYCPCKVNEIGTDHFFTEILSEKLKQLFLQGKLACGYCGKSLIEIDYNDEKENRKYDIIDRRVEKRNKIKSYNEMRLFDQEIKRKLIETRSST